MFKGLVVVMGKMTEVTQSLRCVPWAFGSRILWTVTIHRISLQSSVVIAISQTHKSQLFNCEFDLETEKAWASLDIAIIMWKRKYQGIQERNGSSFHITITMSNDAQVYAVSQTSLELNSLPRFFSYNEVSQKSPFSGNILAHLLNCIIFLSGMNYHVFFRICSLSLNIIFVIHPFYCL